MLSAAPGFTPKTLTFLRALKRNNRREWFHERRADYDQHVHAPMVAVVEQLALDFAKVAPDFVANPKISMFRPWRDTRFSSNKAPLKTNVAAVFPHRALGRMQGAGLYFEVSTESVWIGGGLYAPDAAMLYAVRQHIADHHRELATLVAAPKFKALLGAVQGTSSTRMPRGFDAAHPAPQAVPGGARRGAGVCRASGLLQAVARHLHGDGAVRELPERADRRDAPCDGPRPARGRPVGPRPARRRLNADALAARRRR
jgi:uncharacterized protein (TIGR02453 family)